MQSNQTAIIPILKSPSDDEKIEVSLESSENGQHVILKYSTWTEGLGWCGQKTIRFNSEHLDHLHRALTVARHRVMLSREDAESKTQTAKVIQLPTLG